MKILFMLDKLVSRGSIQAVANYVRAGEELGHVVAVHGRPDPAFPGMRFSTQINAFDYAVLIFESGLDWLSALRLPRLLAALPRDRRFILDADGMFNPVVRVDGYDRNHADETSRQRWLAHFQALSDRIAQPTFTSREVGVDSLLFYGYSARVPRDHGAPKRWDILHVGHNWWRWREVSRVLLPALEQAGSRIGSACFLGSWWASPPAGATELGLEAAFEADPERFRQLRIEIHPPVPYNEVIHEMSRSRINIMTQRPLFRSLRLITSKYFEIFSADTIPLVMLDPDHAETVYGSAGRELTVNDRDEVAEKLVDALARPRYYRDVVEEVRRHLEEHHSYRRRLEELTALLGSGAPAGDVVGAGADRERVLTTHPRVRSAP